MTMPRPRPIIAVSNNNLLISEKFSRPEEMTNIKAAKCLAYKLFVSENFSRIEEIYKHLANKCLTIPCKGLK